MIRAAAALLLVPLVDANGNAGARCPFPGAGAPPPDHPVPGPATVEEFLVAARALDYDAVKADLTTLMTASQDFWPADYGHYGGLMIRGAWHCSGSYRGSDGRGGCDGARIRFDPERSWEDNANLDKARKLLLPVKLKYGLGLSWGDLIVLAGNVAIESMGGPVLGFCAGRVDAADGTASVLLGESKEQEELYPCDQQGNCTAPLGSVQVGLIYVNPGGPMGVPDKAGSARQIREVFGRMGMNDSETVALIGGGHAFGKTHGACPDGAGPSPAEDPANPWPGNCGTGKGKDAWTSGFEVTWSPTPTVWSNSFFTTLRDQQFEMYTGPGGNNQWRVQGAAGGALENVTMLTSDVALMHDPEGEYQKLVQKFADNITELEIAFSHAWYKLTTRDMGPALRCVGNDVPAPQEFQAPLPKSPETVANFGAVRAELRSLAGAHGAAFVRLAWRCASTFRATDYSGGCNGARILLEPERSWPGNEGLDTTLGLLSDIKAGYGATLSWADLIVLAGTVAVEEAGGKQMTFCGGRVDADSGVSPKPTWDDLRGSIAAVKNAFSVMGLSGREYVSLAGALHSIGAFGTTRDGFSGVWSATPGSITNEYFTSLLTKDWVLQSTGASGEAVYKATGHELNVLKSDLTLRWDAELSAVAEEYAGDNAKFLEDLGLAWDRAMTMDSFGACRSGSVNNVVRYRGNKEDSPMSTALRNVAVSTAIALPLLLVTL